MGVVLPGRQLLNGDMHGTMTQLTQLDIMAEPDEDGHEECSLTTFDEDGHEECSLTTLDEDGHEEYSLTTLE
eukprot:329107-Chlamydomonas_euryale.AAC.27